MRAIDLTDALKLGEIFFSQRKLQCAGVPKSRLAFIQRYGMMIGPGAKFCALGFIPQQSPVQGAYVHF